MDIRFMPSAGEEPLEQLTVKELVTIIQDLPGSHEASNALGVLFQRYERGLLLYVMRNMRNRADAEELVQDVFVRATTRIDQLKEPDAFGKWLYTIAWSLIINFGKSRLGKQRKFAASSGDMSYIPDSYAEDSPLQTLIEEERAEIMQRAIGEMNNFDPDAIRAFYYNREPIKDTAERLGVPEGTVKRRLHVARKRLAAVLSDQHPEHFVD